MFRLTPHLIKSILWIIASLFIATPVLADKGIVNVYNWSDYIDEEILTDFEKQTGIKVIYDVYDSNEILETKLLAGNSGYDVVVPSASFLQRQVQAGVFQKLDQSKLPNAVNLWDKILSTTAVYDPDNQYSINYMWGTTGLGINKEKILALHPEAPLDSWDLIFDPKHAQKIASCGIYVLDASDEIVPAALSYMGLDPMNQTIDNIKKARKTLQKIRPFVKKFHSSEYINALANGDICLAIGWSGDILQARDRAAEADNGVVVDYIIPKQGALMWFDQMAIPADAPNPINAHTFLNYMMNPKVMAKASNYVYYANGNLASQAYLVEEVISDNAIYPDAATMAKLYAVQAYQPKAQRALTRLWTKLKTSQ